MKILMHMCCAPCAVYPESVLRDEGAAVDCYFYNPNIHPIDEFTKRKQTVQSFAGMTGVSVFFREDFMQSRWEEFKGLPEDRCRMCYTLRLEETARYAALNKYDAFTTTLLVSPYQKHEMIREISEKAAVLYKIQFYYRDFRTGYREGQRRAKEMGLYRQKYCGCIISLAK